MKLQQASDVIAIRVSKEDVPDLARLLREGSGNAVTRVEEQAKLFDEDPS